MFKLLKLAFYALVGYAIYEFIRGAMGGEIESAWNRVTEAAHGGGQRGGRNPQQRDPARVNMTGPGEGQVEETQESDGGSVRHAVGRGVVRR